MSTRANIIIIDDSGDKLFFYRHDDGYPEGTLPTLSKFMKMVAAGKIRNNVIQAAGHLILIGHKEYAKIRKEHSHTRWQVGSYAPTTEIHGDIKYLYTLNLDKLTIETLTPDGKPIDGHPAIGFAKKKDHFIK